MLNRGNCRLNIFSKAGDYAAFIKILGEGRRRTDTQQVSDLTWQRRCEPVLSTDYCDFFNE